LFGLNLLSQKYSLQFPCPTLPDVLIPILLIQLTTRRVSISRKLQTSDVKIKLKSFSFYHHYHGPYHTFNFF